MTRFLLPLLAGLFFTFAGSSLLWADESVDADVVDSVDAEVAEPGDDTAESTSTAFDTEHRIQIYEANRLRPWRAVAYTAAFPGIGNFYAEQYALGTVAISAMVFAGMFVGFGLTHGHTNLIQLGGIIAGSAYVGGGITSYFGARSHNRRLRRNLHIDNDYEASLPSAPPGVSVTLRF